MERNGFKCVLQWLRVSMDCLFKHIRFNLVIGNHFWHDLWHGDVPLIDPTSWIFSALQ